MVSCVPGAGLYVKNSAGRGLCFEIVRVLSSLSSGLVFGIIPPKDPREGTSLGRESFNHQPSQIHPGPKYYQPFFVWSLTCIFCLVEESIHGDVPLLFVGRLDLKKSFLSTEVRSLFV